MNERSVRLSLALSLTVLSFSLLFLFYFGWQIGQTALTDPDTCFLVAVGRQILENGLPANDVFSWTAARPYIVYQWLAAIVFAALFKLVGPQGLVILTGLVVLYAFFVIPVLVARQVELPRLPLLVAAALGTAAASFHFPCRPEIFSYLLLSMLIAFCCLPWPGLAAVALCSMLGFILWTNLHSGFVLGLALLFVLALCSLLPGRHLIAPSKLWAALLAALAGSLFSPYGMALWTYLPHLFFSRVNRLNLELLPLSIWELLTFDYMPFLGLLALVFAGLLYVLKDLMQKNGKLSFSDNLLAFSILAALAPCMAIGCRRLLPFAVLLIYGFVYAFFLAQGHARRQLVGAVNESEVAKNNGAAGLLDLVLRPWCAIGFCSLATVAGIAVATSFFPASLPQTTFGFELPSQALAFIDQERPQGKLLNDPQFGDVLLLRYGPKAQVFIDTRFDLYGDDLVLDFWNMANLRGDWQKLLARYEIDWIFFPPRAPIVDKLRGDRAWRQVFADNTAVLLVRQSREN
jgi:hypothetical protein